MRWVFFPVPPAARGRPTAAAMMVSLAFLVVFATPSKTIVLAAPPKPPPPVELPCPNPTFGGVTFDISSIKGHKLSYTSPQTGIKFSFGVCTAVPTGPPLCKEPDVSHKTAMLAYCPDFGTTGVGVVEASPKVIPKYKPVTSGKEGKVIGIQADLPSVAQLIKFVGLKYLCNDKASTPQMRVTLPPKGKVPMGFNITITTKAACGSSGGNGAGSGSNWSTWFFVIFSCSVILYCGCGCFINIKRNGESLSSACPQKSFWFGLPGLVLDGIAFFCSCFGIGSGAVGGSSSSSNAYSATDFEKLNEPQSETSAESDTTAGGYGTQAPAQTGLPNPYGTVSGAPTPRRKKVLSSSGRHNKEMADAFADTDDF